jgi:hypothetical protein
MAVRRSTKKSTEMTVKTKPAAQTKRRRRRTRAPEPSAPRIAWRITEWATMTGVSKASVYRGVNSGALRWRRFNGLTLIEGFSDKAAAE